MWDRASEASIIMRSNHAAAASALGAAKALYLFLAASARPRLAHNACPHKFSCLRLPETEAGASGPPNGRPVTLLTCC